MKATRRGWRWMNLIARRDCVAVESTRWWYKMGRLKRVLLSPMSDGQTGALPKNEAIDANNLVGCALRMQQGEDR